jgi:alkylation response protein AidB-like acyl-CoA dehydrogenase
MAADTTAEGEAIVEAARALTPQIRAAAEEIEAGRRLPQYIVDAMKRAGAFRMTMPRAWGGPELDPLSQIRVIEALSYGDGSVGWCAMINSDGGYFSAYLEPGVARELYQDLDAPTGGSLLFSGRAEALDGGYRVNGRWPFVSGCQHCDWLIFSCNLFEKGEPRMMPNGTPARRFCLVPAHQVEVLDTWHTTGLRGSGSHDVAIKDLFVPGERTHNFPAPPRRTGALYAYPLMFAYNLPGVTLGIARAAIDSFIEVAPRRQVTMSMVTGKPVMLRDEVYAQTVVARAEALVGSARDYIFARMDDIWQTLLAGGQPSPKQRALYRIAIAHAHAVCVEAVEGLFKAYGGGAVYKSSPFDRCLRDLLTINQHTMNSLKVNETAGRVLLGFAPAVLNNGTNAVHRRLRKCGMTRVANRSSERITSRCSMPPKSMYM